MKKALYWLPYFPIIGYLFVLIFGMDVENCVLDDKATCHFGLTAILQGASIGLMIQFLIIH